METKAIVQDQKKCALDALERRFAVAKAEALHQQARNKRRFDERDQGLKSSIGPQLQASPSPRQNLSLKKDSEADGLTYSRICLPVHENLLPAAKVSNREKSTVDKILHELLQKGDTAQKYIQGSRSAKIDNWILLDNFVQGQRTSLARLRALQNHSKRSKRHMSMKQHKICGSLDLSEEFQKFELFMPMHEMWKEYVIQLLKNSGKNQVATYLHGADLHGAILRVVECKIEAFIGLVGIMIRETSVTFGIIAQDNKFRVVPKKNSVFVLQASCWRITLHGDKFTSRKPGS